MNPAHLHLLVNHIPTLGFIIGGALLAWAVFTKDEPLHEPALIVLVIVALIAIPAFLTGGGARHAIENVPGVSLGAIALHEEAAELALWGMEAAGVAALGAIFLRKRESTLAGPAVRATLLLVLVAILLMGRADNFGASIRHGEVAGENPMNGPSTRQKQSR